MLTMSYAWISRRLAQVTDEIKTAGLVQVTRRKSWSFPRFTRTRSIGFW
jgi:hypothetical protein